MAEHHQSLLWYRGYTLPETGGIHVHKFAAKIKMKEDNPEQPELDVEGKLQFYDVVHPLYPTKAFPYPEAIADCNFVKRLIVSEGKFYSNKLVLLALSFTLFLPFKYKIKLLEHWIKSYTGMFEITLDPHYLEERYMTEIAREVLTFIKSFLIKLGVSEKSAYILARTISHLLEYDTAYRWRLEDILSESKKELWSDPAKEIRRLVGILAQRDDRKHLVEKFDNYAKILNIVLKLPRIKKAFKESIEESNFKNFQYDDIDRHTVMPLDGYDFFGESAEVRVKRYIDLYNGNPPLTVSVN